MAARSCRPHTWSKVTILFSSFGLHFVSIGMVQSFGVMYSELRDQLGSSAAETSWIASLSSGLLLAFGPVAGIMEKRFGCRVVAMLGSVLIGVGMVASAFVPSLHWLYLTYGVITGVGFGMGHLVANVIVNLKFDKHRSVAIAIATAGGGCGNIVIPWLTTLWLEVYGWRQTFLLLAGTGIQGIVFGAIICNVHTSKESHEKHQNDVNPDRTSLRGVITAVLKTESFLIFSLSGFCIAMGYFVPYLMIPELAKAKGVSGTSSILGRILVGFIVDFAQTNRIWTLAVTLFIGGVSTIGCAFIYDRWLFIAYGVILGVFTGTFGFLQSLIVVDLLGTELLGIGFGFLTLFHGIAVIIGPPLAGWISDMTNNNIVSFIYAGILFCLGSLFASVIRIRAYCSVSKPDLHTADHVSQNQENGIINGSHANSNFVFDTKL